MWYGLLKDGGELISVQFFTYEPSIMDFNCCYFSWCNYEVVEVEVSIK